MELVTSYRTELSGAATGNCLASGNHPVHDRYLMIDTILSLMEAVY